MSVILAWNARCGSARGGGRKTWEELDVDDPAGFLFVVIVRVNDGVEDEWAVYCTILSRGVIEQQDEEE